MERLSEIALRAHGTQGGPDFRAPEAFVEPIHLTLWEKYTRTKTTTRFQTIRRAIILVLYFIVGAAIYSTYEEWSVGTSFAFLIVTISTVGFGYHAPTTQGTRLFTAFYMIFGIYFVFWFVSETIAQNFTYYTDVLKQKMNSAIEVGQEYKNNLYHMIANIVALVLCIIVGAISLMVLEDWTFIDSFYFAMQTSTTVGYGDLDLHNRSTHLFLAFYIVFSTALFAFTFKNLQALRIKQKQLQKLEVLMEKREQLDFLTELDNGSGVSEEQFVLAILLHLGTISYDSDVRPWIEKFAAMDQRKQGRLYRPNLAVFTSTERAMAADEREQLEQSRAISVMSLASSLDPRPSLAFKMWNGPGPSGEASVANFGANSEVRSHSNPIHSPYPSQPPSIDSTTSSRRPPV